MSVHDYRILRIFINEKDRYQKKPLHDWIIHKALDENVASATVFRGLEGIDGERKLHTVKLVTLSIDLPIVVEVIDKEDTVYDFLKLIEPAIGDGIVTIEKAQVKFYKKNR